MDDSKLIYPKHGCQSQVDRPCVNKDYTYTAITKLERVMMSNQVFSKELLEQCKISPNDLQIAEKKGKKVEYSEFGNHAQAIICQGKIILTNISKI